MPRNKMQCPECGVMCPVPARPAAKKKAEERPPAEDAALFDDEPAPLGRRRRRRGRRRSWRSRRRPAKGWRTAPIAASWSASPAQEGQRGQVPRLRRRLAGNDGDEEAGAAGPARPAAPGRVRRLDARRGPRIRQPLPHRRPRHAAAVPDAATCSGRKSIVCVRCGFDLRTGRKTVKEYGKFERSWDSGMPPADAAGSCSCSARPPPLIAIGAAFFTLTAEDSLVRRRHDVRVVLAGLHGHDRLPARHLRPHLFEALTSPAASS